MLNMFTNPIHCAEFPYFLHNYFHFMYCFVNVLYNAKIDLGIVLNPSINFSSIQSRWVFLNVCVIEMIILLVDWA